MRRKTTMANSEQMSIFDMLGDYGFEEKEEVKTEAEATAEEVKAEAAEDDSTDDAATVETAEEKKPAPAKPVAKKAGAKKLTGPVKLIGTGWTFEYGDPGLKYEAKEAIKAAFNAGFKETALATFSSPKDSSVIYVSTVNNAAGEDDLAVGAEVTVILGRKASIYKAEDFPGLDADEISLGDVLEKFVSARPEFKGCGLSFRSGIAVPVFDADAKLDLTKESVDTLSVWGEDGIKEYSGQEAALLFEDATLYKSESDIVFPVYQARGKGILSYYMSADDFGLKASPAKTVEEKYALPCTIYLETFGQKKEVTSSDFDGKAKITKQDVIDYLKPQYKEFQSKSRKFDIVYEKAQNIVSVALISGEKGAAAIAAFPLFRVSSPRELSRPAIVAAFPVKTSQRVENTDLGVFSGTQDAGGRVVLNSFKLTLTKIPINLLKVIVQSFKASAEVEDMVQIYWSRKGHHYYIRRPEQDVSKVHVSYRMRHTKDILALSIHSHNTMAPAWSSVDDEDEVYTGLFGCVGHVDREYPEIRLRAGMEGSFIPVDLFDIFDPNGVA